MATVPIVAAAATDSTVGATYEMGYDVGYNTGYSAGVAAGAGECASNPTGCGISFAALAASRTWYGETEANDNIVSADPLALDQGFLAQSYDVEDQDWFYVVADEQNTNLTVNFSMPNMAVGSLSGWVVSIRDAIGMRIAEFNTNHAVVADAREGMNYYVTLGLAGTYYVVVKPAADAFNYNQYQIKASLEAAANTGTNFVVGFYDAETEPNNDPTVADVVTKGVSMYGLINLTFNGVVTGDPVFTWGQGEDDWYVYDSPGNEIVLLSFCDRETCSAGNWLVQVFDEAGIDRADVNNYWDTCGNAVTPPPNGCGGVEPLLSYDEAALVSFNTTSCGNSPCDCELDCLLSPTIWNIGLEHAGKYYMRVNHKRRVDAPCAAYGLDSDNNGVADGAPGSCGCTSGYNCQISVPNTGDLVATRTGEYPPCANGTGGGDSAFCQVQCIGQDVPGRVDMGGDGIPDGQTCNCPSGSFPCNVTVPNPNEAGLVYPTCPGYLWGNDATCEYDCECFNFNSSTGTCEDNDWRTNVLGTTCSCPDSQYQTCRVIVPNPGTPTNTGSNEYPECPNGTGGGTTGVCEVTCLSETQQGQMDLNGDGLADGSACSCPSGSFPCTAIIPNSGSVTSTTVLSYPACPDGSGGGENAQCDVGCVCSAFGSVVELPLWNDTENSMYTSQYNFSWITNPRGSEITTPSNSTITTDAYQDYINRPSAY